MSSEADSIESLLIDYQDLRTNGAIENPLSRNEIQDEPIRALTKAFNILALPDCIEDGTILDLWNEFKQTYDDIDVQLRGICTILYSINHYYAGMPLRLIQSSNKHWIGLGIKLWDPLDYNRTPRDNQRHFSALRWSGQAKLDVTLENDALYKGFNSAGSVINLRLHSLHIDTIAYFNTTRPVSDHEDAMGIVLQRLESKDDTGAFNEEGYIQEIERATKEACDANVHILCFPELCITEAAREVIKSTMLKHMHSELFVTIAGSTHVKGRAEYFNRGVILIRDGVNVTELAEFTKRAPASYPTGIAKMHPGLKSALKEVNARQVIEHIRPSQNYTVVVSAIGLIGIVICKDLLETETHVGDLCRFVDHLFVVSMNSRPNVFLEQAVRLSGMHDVAFYYVNAQHCAKEDKDVECAVQITPFIAKLGRKPPPSVFHSSLGKSYPHGGLVQTVTQDGVADFKVVLP